MAVCFNMLKATLCGNYINFGVFQLYGDRALDDALNMFIQIVISIPHNSLLVSLCGVVIEIYNISGIHGSIFKICNNVECCQC